MRPSRRSRLPAPPAYVVAGTICWGAAFGGLDSAIGQGLICLSHCALLAWLVLCDAYSPSIVRRNAAVFGLLGLAWLWSIFVTWIFIGGLPEEAYARMARNFGAIAALLSGLIVSRIPGRREQALDWMAIMLAFLSLLALIWWTADPNSSAWAEGLEKNRRFRGFVGNVNVNATLAAVAAVWSGWRTLRVWTTWYYWSVRQRLLSVALVGAFCVNFLVVFLSATRMVNFTLSLVAIGGLAFYVLQRRPDLRPARRHMVTAVGLVLAVVVFQSFGPVSDRYDVLNDGLAGRLDIWARCFAMFGERPLSGFGLASFPAAYAHFLPDPRTAAQIWTVNSPHNVLLQILLTGGAPYLVLLGSAGLLIARRVLIGLRAGSGGGDQRVICAMLVIVLASSSVDIALDYPLSIGLFALLTGFLLGQPLDGRKVRVADPGRQSREDEPLVGRSTAKHRQHDRD